MNLFASLFGENEGAIVREWADAVYAEPRTDLPSLLSYRELIDGVPELLEELARVLDERAEGRELAASAARFRARAQVRFQQGCLIDEVARELMLLRRVLIDFLWRAWVGVTDGDHRELRGAVRRTDAFVDELIAQAIITYASCLRPPVRTRVPHWPPVRRRTRPAGR
jgi:RsbT co-antagonist protein rsbRD N-terminal domain